MSTPHVLIPTGYKSKLGVRLSWPIGAEELSKALVDVPQYEQLKMDFWHYQREINGYDAVSWMTLLRVNYGRYGSAFSASKEMIERGYFGQSWSMEVSPVLREERKKLHDQFLLQLPHVASWLSKHSTLQGNGSMALLVVWDKQKDMVYTSTEDHLEPERISKAIRQPL